MVKIRGNLLNVSAEEIYGVEISVEKGIVKCVENIRGNFKHLILPGFIDSHIHIESSMLTPSRFAEAVVPHGTTAVISDPHEIANVMGIEGINYMIKDASTVPLKMFITAPSCVPTTLYETSGAMISTEEIEFLLQNDDVVALGEIMNFPEVLEGNPNILAKLEVAKRFKKPIDGHAPFLSGLDLCKYIMSGISTDHECSSVDEVIEKRRLGMKIMLREGSSAKNLKDLAFAGGDFIVSDDKHPEDLLNGHVDEMLKKAIEYGIDPLDAIKMVTINPAEHYNLNNGNLIPRKVADIVLVDNIEKLNIKKVIIDGKLVAEDGKPCFNIKTTEIPSTFKLKQKKSSEFDITAKGSIVTVKVMEVFDGQIITKKVLEDLKIKNGKIEANINNDILKIAVVGRYGNENVSNAFVKGFGIKDGAIASSVAHDSHNIIVVGTNSEDMAEAVNIICKNKGGLSAVSNGIMYSLELPIAGLMSYKSLENVSSDLKILHDAVKDMGSHLRSPFMTLSFMALLVIPELKISDKGLFDVEKFEFVNLIK
ncbi:MAG: adenine deaminase [Methanobacterium sp.]|nr:adenine deaminase [Methanobacterium sp.]